MIVHLIGQLGRGGAEKQLFALASALERRGWRQAVVSFLPDGTWAPRFSAIGIPVSSIPRTRMTPWRYWQLRRMIRRWKARVIVSWSAHVAVYADWLFAVGTVARVINVRGNLTNRNAIGTPRQGLGLLRRALERADCVVSNSRRNLDALCERGVRLPKTEVIYNIVAEETTPRPSPAAQIPRIVAVGSLFPLKSYDVLIGAAAILAEKATNFELLLAGDGGERSRLEALANQLGLSQRVKFLGDVEDVAGLLRTADVFAHPAITEGLSNAILEALAQGVPVVACPVGGTPEIITDGQNGLLVPVQQPQAMAEAIGRLLNDASLRHRLARAGLATVRERFSESSIASQYETVFHRLITDQR
jgi:glycosyltransferase involved in cell wall biosynthesis